MDPLYLRPAQLDEALAALAERPLTILAGGTDIYPALVGRPANLDVLDITGLEELSGLGREDGHWRLGALTRWSDLVRGDLPPMLAGLRRAAREVGGVQIQNAGTIGGNICNASPAADSIPCLLGLDARVELASVRGGRELPLAEFVRGNRRTARERDELLTAVLLPAPSGEVVSHFLKLGGRRYLVISIVMAAFALEVEGCRIVKAGVAIGACAPTAMRLPELQSRLTGAFLRAGLERVVDESCLAPLSPIDDIRATAAYRRDVCLALLRRGLADLAGDRRLAA
jgi:CO/xanthine dehydrogenase FAD-binding subunit